MALYVNEILTTKEVRELCLFPIEMLRECAELGKQHYRKKLISEKMSVTITRG
jgi:hypothetical protein